MEGKNEVQKLEAFKTAWSGHRLDPSVACVVVVCRWLFLALWWSHQQLEGRSTPGGGGQWPSVKQGPASSD